MRQVILDTETTGIDPKQGHRIIEIGCVEMIDRKLTNRHFHVYINPQREVEVEAFNVHGISNEFLADKPLFHEISKDFIEFIQGAELIIHNAPFDIGFINHEFLKQGLTLKTADICSVFDTLSFARKKHPGQKNNLDALCKRYGIDNSHRELHGALLDSEILADVYLLMTGGQTSLGLGQDESGDSGGASNDVWKINRLPENRTKLAVIRADESEVKAHNDRLDMIEKSAGRSLWREQEENSIH